MSLTQEYTNQNQWRNWEQYIDKLPIQAEDVVLDMGCSLGFVSRLLAKKAKKVIGIDLNDQLIRKAQTLYSATNIDFRIGNLSEIGSLGLPVADGIWSSFTAAYFVDFESVLDTWLALLKPGGWIALIEINDLLGHGPISKYSQDIFKSFYKHQLRKGLYDFEMGSKLKNYLDIKNLQVIYEASVYDKELAFNGPAEPQIVDSWKMRFSRMKLMQEFLGKESHNVLDEFMQSLADKGHFCNSEVKFLIARKL